MRRVVFTILFLLVVLFSFTAYGYDRYVYSASSPDGDEYYVDSASILRINNPDAVRYWVIVSISDAGRRRRVSEAVNKEQRVKLSRLSEVKMCNDIIFEKNLCRAVEEIGYDSKGHVLYSIQQPSYMSNDWKNIPPGTIIEGERDTVMRILRGEIPASSKQPSSIARPQIKVPLSASEQREEYDKLFEYVSWLIKQPDYPEFDAWVAQKAQQHGMSIIDVSNGIQEYVRRSGGKYSEVRAMLASWYREFYMDRYGSK